MRTALSRLSSITAHRASGTVQGAGRKAQGAGGIRTLHSALCTLHPIWPLLAAACLASALVAQAAARDEAAADVARLESIAGQSDAHTGSILIQTSEPVPYVTADPDPITVLVELRNVTSKGFSNRLAGGVSGSVSAVTVEDGTAVDGAPVARVRVSLTRPLGHRVRSTRNVIRVEVDREPSAANAGATRENAQTAKTRTPATVLSSLRAMDGPAGPIVVLEGNGLLKPTNVELTKEQPYRLVLDFAGVSPAVKSTTPVGSDPVDRVRVARHSAAPLVTRVVVDLKRSVAYRIDESAGGISIVFGAPAQTASPAPTAAVLPASNPAKTAEEALPAQAQQQESQTPSVQDTSDLLRRLRALQAQQPTAAAQPSAATAPPARPAAETRPSSSPVSQPSAQPPSAAVKEPAPAAVPASAAPAPPGVPEKPPEIATASNPVVRQAIPVGQPTAPPPQSSVTTAPPPRAPIESPAEAPAVTAAQDLQVQQSAQKKYTGAPISLDFAGSDIRQVLRVFSDSSGLNIIIDPKVQGTVDISMRDVPWDQAMEIILKSAGLGYTLDGNVVRIAPLDVLKNEEMQRRQLEDEKALAGQLETLTRTLSYAAAKDIRGVVEKSALTKRGSIETDDRTNTLIIRDLPTALPAAARIIDTLDRPQPQVEIEARIVQTTRTFARQLGIKWGFMGQASQVLGNATGLAFPNTAAMGGRTGGTSASGVTPMVNLGTTGPATSAVGISLGAVNGSFNLDIELSALESQGKGRILSTPRVLALNNFPAMMMQGVQIPIQVVANNTVTVSFKDAALKLEVTPQVTANQTVIMNINLENATPDYTKSVMNIPPINTQIAKTQVLTNDNQTIVIGGVFVSREQTQNDHTPGLSRIPLLGWLFRRDDINDESNELLIFLTPRIVKEVK